MSGEPDDLDNPWKEALDHFLDLFLAFCFPVVHAGIDWRRGYESLDKELQQIAHDAKAGKRLADKLFKVWRTDGTEAWLLIHIEVQGQRERNFPERMFVYSYRIYNLYRRPVVSLAVLCDEQPGWRPDHFGYNIWGCSVEHRFPSIKLLDYRGKEAELEQSPNPFAAILLAHLKVLETRGVPQTRWQWKLRLVKGLYERGLKREQIRHLFRVLDWMLALPKELDVSFNEELHRFEEERRMPYVTSIERLGLERGREEGREEGREQGLIAGARSTIRMLLKARGFTASNFQQGLIDTCADLATLQRWSDAALTAASADEIFK